MAIWRSYVQEEVAELRGEVEELQTQLLRHQVVHNRIGSDGFQCQASSMCIDSLKEKMNDILSGGGGGADSLVRLGKVSEPGLGGSCRCWKGELQQGLDNMRLISFLGRNGCVQTFVKLLVDSLPTHTFWSFTSFVGCRITGQWESTVQGSFNEGGKTSRVLKDR